MFDKEDKEVLCLEERNSYNEVLWNLRKLFLDIFLSISDSF